MSEVQKEAGVEMQRQDSFHLTCAGPSGASTAREAGVAPGAWQPIATAPKDGTEVVLAEKDEYDGRWRFASSYWRDYFPGFGSGFGWVGHAPTHWMPLPDAPSLRSADTEGTGQISPESAPAPESDPSLLLLLQAAQALEDISRMPPITGMDQTFTRKCGHVAAGLRQRIGREK